MPDGRNRTQITCTMDTFIACCGLNCGTCEARKATINNDDNLRREVSKKWCAMNNTDQITPETINCMGCRTEGVKFYFCSHLCQIRQCVASHSFQTCGECADIDRCEKIKMIIDHNDEARDNLKAASRK